MLGLVLTRKQRLLDLYIALGMQVAALILTSELLRTEAQTPFVGLTIGTYIATSLATLYVLVVAEFKPVAMETCTFMTWIVCNAAFAATMLVPPSTQDQPNNLMMDREPEPRVSVAPKDIRPKTVLMVNGR
jgi:hypothetical protein